MEKTFIELNLCSLLENQISEVSNFNDASIDEIKIEITAKTGEKLVFTTDEFQLALSEFEEF